MKNFTPELIAKAKATKSAQELFELAKANNVELTEDEAKTYFAQLNANDAISDDELGAVAGGGSCPGDDDEEHDSNNALRTGYAVRVTDGSRCSGCESDWGVTKALSPSDTTVGVFCNNCRKWITTKATKDNVIPF
jgi:hypothetical protein